MTEYLSEYSPDFEFPPGETLLETLDALNMTQAELAERMGRPKKTISEIISGKTAITPETALQLERVLGTPASFWQNLEGEYRAFKARESETEDLAADVEVLTQFPVKQMIKYGWIADKEEKTELLRSLLGFFAVASFRSWEKWWLSPDAAYRKSEAFESNPWSVAAWLRQGEILAQQTDCLPYDRTSFENALAEARSLTKEGPDVFVPRLGEIGAATGVAVVFVPDLPKTRVCGASKWLSKEKALIQLGLRYKTNDQLWFTFFHEAGHLLRDGKTEVFLDGVQGANDERETAANKFAADFLIPPADYQKLLSLRGMRGFAESTVHNFADHIGIAPAIVVGRLQHDGLVDFKNLNGLKVRLRWAES